MKRHIFLVFLMSSLFFGKASGSNDRKTIRDLLDSKSSHESKIREIKWDVSNMGCKINRVKNNLTKVKNNLTDVNARLSQLEREVYGSFFYKLKTGFLSFKNRTSLFFKTKFRSFKKQFSKLQPQPPKIIEKTPIKNSGSFISRKRIIVGSAVAIIVAGTVFCAYLMLKDRYKKKQKTENKNT